MILEKWKLTEPGENRPSSLRDTVLERADVLHHEAAFLVADRSRHCRESDEMRRLIGVIDHQVANGNLSIDRARELVHHARVRELRLACGGVVLLLIPA